MSTYTSSYTREPAWRFGTKVDGTSCIEALHLANLDYNIYKHELITTSGLSVPKFALFREPTSDREHRFLGFCGSSYSYLQNSQIAEIIDPLTEMWPVDTAGDFDHGKTVFFSLDAGTVTICGDEVHQYFLVVDSRDGGTSLKIMFTPVRVVCQNTLVTAQRSTIRSVINHRQNIANSVSIHVGLLQKMQRVMIDMVDVFNKMSATLSMDAINTVITSAYPMPKKPRKADFEVAEEILDDESAQLLLEEAKSASDVWEYYCEKTNEHRANVIEILHNIDTPQPNTGWAVYNAVVEYADYRPGAESRQLSALFGPRAQEKIRAFNAVMDAIKER